MAAGWEVTEWQKEYRNHDWKRLADGFRSVPFALTVDDTSDAGAGSTDADGDAGTGPPTDTPRVLVDPGGHPDGGPRRVDGLTGRFPESVTGGRSVVDFGAIPLARSVDVGETPPRHVRSLVRAESDLRSQRGSLRNVVETDHDHGDRRYYQGRVRPGQTVFVLGHARRREDEPTLGDGPEAVVVTPPRADEPGVFVLSTRDRADLLTGEGTPVTVAVAGLLAVLVGLSLLLGGSPSGL